MRKMARCGIEYKGKIAQFIFIGGEKYAYWKSNGRIKFATVYEFIDLVDRGIA